jgi:RimJ/RimL family protein N-acetyltransferase
MPVQLQPFSADDFPRVIAWIQTPEMMVQWGGSQLFSFPLDARQLQIYLHFSQGDKAIARIYKVVNEAGEVVGHIELGAINPYNGTASICRVFIDPLFRGRGYCADMVRQVMAVGFNELGLRRIDLRVYAFNNPAIQCYQAAGFKYEGLLRQAQRVGDQLWDVVLMAIMHDEWLETLEPAKI